MGRFLFRASHRLSLPLGRSETLERVGSLIGPSGRPFVGRIDGGEFEIRRITVYRSTFLPVLRGTVLHGAGGAEILLRMRPHRQVIFFLVIWYGFLLAASLLIAVLGEGAQRLLLLLPLGLGAATWVLSALVFESDCRWAVRSFEAALQGEGRWEATGP